MNTVQDPFAELELNQLFHLYRDAPDGDPDRELYAHQMRTTRAVLLVFADDPPAPGRMVYEGAAHQAVRMMKDSTGFQHNWDEWEHQENRTNPLPPCAFLHFPREPTRQFRIHLTSNISEADCRMLEQIFNQEAAATLQIVGVAIYTRLNQENPAPLIQLLRFWWRTLTNLGEFTLWLNIVARDDHPYKELLRIISHELPSTVAPSLNIHYKWPTRRQLRLDPALARFDQFFLGCNRQIQVNAKDLIAAMYDNVREKPDRRWGVDGMSDTFRIVDGDLAHQLTTLGVRYCQAAANILEQCRVFVSLRRLMVDLFLYSGMDGTRVLQAVAHADLPDLIDLRFRIPMTVTQWWAPFGMPNDLTDGQRHYILSANVRYLSLYWVNETRRAVPLPPADRRPPGSDAPDGPYYVRLDRLQTQVTMPRALLLRFYAPLPCPDCGVDCLKVRRNGEPPHCRRWRSHSLQYYTPFYDHMIDYENAYLPEEAQEPPPPPQ